MPFSEYMPSWNGVIFFGQTCSTLMILTMTLTMALLLRFPPV
jgi:hypothetical protein